MRDFFSVLKKYLLLFAGMAWVFAGTMVIKTGLPLFMIPGYLGYKIILAAGIFIIFYFFIFAKLVTKHTHRILTDPRPKMPFWEFFDGKSYIVMAIMITGGITIRKLGLLPKFVIGFFYIGLGTALFLCGVMFIIRFLKFETAG